MIWVPCSRIKRANIGSLMTKTPTGLVLLFLALLFETGCGTRCDEAISLCESCESLPEKCGRLADKSAEHCEELIVTYEALCAQ